MEKIFQQEKVNKRRNSNAPKFSALLSDPQNVTQIERMVDLKMAEV